MVGVLGYHWYYWDLTFEHDLEICFGSFGTNSKRNKGRYSNKTKGTFRDESERTSQITLSIISYHHLPVQAERRA